MSTNSKRKLKPKDFSLYVPDYFDPRMHLSPDLQCLEEEAWYVLHLIRQRHISERVAMSEFVGILAELLRLVIPARGLLPRPSEGPRLPPDYQVLLRDLESNGAIDCNHSYKPGEFATGYRLSPQLRGKYHAKRVTSHRLIERLADVAEKEKKQVKHAIHTHLKRWCSKIEIDGAAHKSLDRLSAETGQAYSSDRTAIEAIERREGAVGFHVDDFGRRVHTKVSGLNKLLRPYLRYKGQSLVNHDIACSQPFFLALMLINAEQIKVRKANWWNLGGLLECGNEFSPFKKFQLPKARKPYSTFLPPVEPFSLETPTPPGPPPYSVRTEFLESLEADGKRVYDDSENFSDPHFSAPPSLVNFLTDCASGRLYDILAIEANQTREQIKERLFGETLFCKIGGERGLAKTVEVLYPYVMTAIRDMKRGTETDRHKISAMLLQRQESAVVLGRICSRIMHERPDVPLWTIHDSILTTAEHSGLILQTMRETFQELGVVPTIRVEDYGAVHSDRK